MDASRTLSATPVLTSHSPALRNERSLPTRHCFSARRTPSESLLLTAFLIGTQNTSHVPLNTRKINYLPFSNRDRFALLGHGRLHRAGAVLRAAQHRISNRQPKLLDLPVTHTKQSLSAFLIANFGVSSACGSLHRALALPRRFSPAACPCFSVTGPPFPTSHTIVSVIHRGRRP